MRKLLPLVLIVVAASFGASAQIGSPYSEKGFGRLADDNFQSNFAMGGASTNFMSGNYLNPSNPASYGSLKYTVAEVGTFVSHNFYSLDTASGEKNHFNLGQFGIGFPIANNIGLAMGMRPFAKTDYSYRIGALNSDNIETERVFRGNGNISELFFGAGWKLGNLSLGANAQYYFGSITKIEQLEFPTETFSNIRDQEVSLIRGVSGNFGLCYKLPIDEERAFQLGTTTSLGARLSADNYQKINNYNNVIVADSDGNLVVVEDHDNGVELLNTEDDLSEGHLTLPFSYNASISYEKKDAFFVGLNYNNTALDNSNYLSENLDFGRVQKLSFGLQYKPQKDAKGLENFWKSVTYRGGIYGGSTPFKTGNSQAMEYGINFGLGFPLRKFKYEGEKFGSYIFASLGYGRLDGAEGTDIDENLVKLNFSVVLNDKWFVKRKFD